MLKQTDCVARFLQGRKGQASSLTSTGEALLDHDWYPLARREGEAILWNPFPYPSYSSRALHSRVAWCLRGAGYGPVELVPQPLALPRERLELPFLYAVRLGRGGQVPAFVHRDPRAEGCAWHLDPWDARLSTYVALALPLGHTPVHAPVLEIPVGAFPGLCRLAPEALRRELLRRFRRAESLAQAAREVEEAKAELAPLCRALGMMREYGHALRGNPFQARARLAGLRSQVLARLHTKEGLVAALGG